MPLGAQLDRLIEELVTKGVRYEEAHREFEKRYIVRVLQRADGSLCKAADQLGMHRNTLTRKLSEHHIRRP